MILSTACAPTTGTSITPTPIPSSTSPGASPASVTPTPTPTPAPVPPAPVVLSRDFPLVGIGGSHVSGVVQVTDRDGSFVVSVSARGFAPGITTIHTVHIHGGSCANPYAGVHLTVLGVLVMATRKTALTQMVGLFASENGIFFTAMAVTQGMPLIIEIGVTLDVILAALVMTILVLRVRSTVDADIADLDRLRG